MTIPADWKAKYLDSIRAAEADERRWRAVEQVLRRLISRLCAAGMGADERLDRQLAKLAAANRRNADTNELEALFASLTDVVAALGPSIAHEHVKPALQALPALQTARSPQATSPERPPGSTSRWDATCAAVAALLEQLSCASAANPAAQALLAKLRDTSTDIGLAEILKQVVVMVRARNDRLASERAETAAVLAHVTERLEDMAGHLTESSGARRSSFDDAESLNAQVLSRVRELTDEVRIATELAPLRSLVAERLKSVADHVRDFRTREQSRFQDDTVRSESLRTRIAELEREAGDLHRNLNQERHRARLDPLTGIANRILFDERLAQELARWQRVRSPASVLLWDIDRFKSINDSYGHAAGDRVLKEVAKCLAGRVRATDLVARLGGEEFVILAVGTPLAAAVTMADELRATIEALRFHFRGTPVRVTASCGVTEFRDDDVAETIFDRADVALYRAKDGGRNLCVAAGAEST